MSWRYRVFFRGEDRDSTCPVSSWLAPAPSTRTMILLRKPAGTCRRAPGQHVLMVGERVRLFVASAGQQGQALAGNWRTTPPWAETLAFLPGRRGALLVGDGSDERGVYVDHQAAGQRFPGDDQPREPSGSAPVRGRSSPAWPGSRPGQGAAQRWAARGTAQHRPQVRRLKGDVAHAGVPNAIAAVSDTSKIPRSGRASSSTPRSAAWPVPPARRPFGAVPYRRHPP
jgi:hypothetical protein